MQKVLSESKFFLTKKLQRVSFWSKKFKTCRTLKQKILNVSDFETKVLQHVRFLNKKIKTRTILWKDNLLLKSHLSPPHIPFKTFSSI